MAVMAIRRTTVVLDSEDEQALAKASRAEGLSQSALIRKGIRQVTAAYRSKERPRIGWLKLSEALRREIIAEDFTDSDA